MKVHQAIANAFLKEGTSVIFGLLGDGQMSWWLSMSKLPGIRIIDVREEGAALAMAEGWAMSTGNTGVCSVTQGPGLSRTTTSLITASRSRTPIVVYTSRTPFNNEHNSQHLDQQRLVEATGAGYIEVLTPAFAQNAVRHAFYRARVERRPIVLCVPHDVQAGECDSDEEEYRPLTAGFARNQRIRPDLERLNEAIGIIAASKRPVVLLGRGAMEPQTLAAAERVINRIGALITTTVIAKGVLGDHGYHAGISGLFSTRSAIRLLHEADCVIAIGAGLNTRTIEGGYLYPNARIIHIDILPHVLMGNDRVADCYIQGDARMTIEAIDAQLSQRGIAVEGYHTAAVREALSNMQADPADFDLAPGTVDPREVMKVIDEGLPSNVGLVTGAGHASISFPIWHMQRYRPLQVYAWSFGCIGQGLATAIGVAVGSAGPLACIEGDAGALQNIQELDTAARLGIKLLYVLLNDEASGAEYHRLKAKGLDTSPSMVRSPDFVGIATGFGCRARLARSLDEVAAGVEEFLSGDGPMVLDVRTSRSVVSISYRRLHYGEDV